VLWWAALNEAPPDVLEFLEFCVSRFTDIHEIFRLMDGPGGNGVLTVGEFEEGIKRLRCKKFKGPDQSQRLDAIFRYLDPSGEGTVSRSEWEVLNQLWREIRLSIAEFVRFLERSYGGSLADAWQALDDDGSGSISEDEWRAGCTRIGYFGPVLPIFRFLDKDDHGSVELEEFQALEAYRGVTPAELVSGMACAGRGTDQPAADLP